MTALTTTCALCELAVGSTPVCDEELSFCCHGCHTVYQILKRAGKLEDVGESPLFQQAVKSGLISNPDLLEQLRNKPKPKELQRLTFEVGEMWCPSCAEIIRLYSLQQEGVFSCVVDYATDLASIEFDPQVVGRERLFSLIRGLGYEPCLLDSKQGNQISRSLLLRFGVAAFCLLNIMMFSYPLYAGDRTVEGALLFAQLSGVAALPVVTYCLWPILKRFFASLQVGLFGMETLVVLGVGSAFGLSIHHLSMGSIDVYFDSMAAIVTLVLLGKMIEARAKFSARDTLTSLTRALPRRGRRGDEWVAVKDLAVGDLIRVCAGEKVVLDGVVVEGSGICDESLMTGEPLPHTKAPGDALLAGSLLVEGGLVFRVVREEKESTLSQIVGQVERGLDHKPAYIRAVDPLIRWIVPVLVLLAASVGYVTGDPIRAITLLLISCPCAIGIAAPLAESLTMSAMAKTGAIIRNRGVLRLLGRETISVFDKTGTVTYGRFELLSEIPSHHAILKALCNATNHPISQTIARSIQEEPEELDHIRIVLGKGMEGTKKGHRYYFGSADFLRTSGIAGEYNEPPGDTTVFFGKDHQLLFALTLADEVRPEAREAMEGLPHPVLLSGDSSTSVQKVAKEIGFSEWFWRHTPLEKQERVQRWREDGEVVLMVGDGVNDAPALSEAQIAISVLAATDLSIQVSDILLTTDDLRVLSRIRALAVKGQRIVTQNLFWAFSYNIIGVGLALCGQLRPLYAAVAMVLSSLAVIANALRIKTSSSK